MAQALLPDQNQELRDHVKKQSRKHSLSFFLSQSERGLTYLLGSELCETHEPHSKLSLLSFCKNKTQTNNTRRESFTKLTSADTLKAENSLSACARQLPKHQDNKETWIFTDRQQVECACLCVTLEKEFRMLSHPEPRKKRRKVLPVTFKSKLLKEEFKMFGDP